MSNTEYEVVGRRNVGSETWNHGALKPGSVVEGRYVDHQTEVGPNKSNLYILEDKNDEKKLWAVWGSAVIDAKFKEIAKGKMVKIKYLGKEKGRAGKEFKNYTFWQGIISPEDEGKVYEHAKSKPKDMMEDEIQDAGPEEF